MSSLTATSSSTTSVAPSPDPAGARRHLRVGIIQSGRIVEERVLRAPKVVTIGPAAGDTFITPPDDGAAGSWRLFQERRGRLVLRLGPGMSARVAAGGDVATLDAPSPSEGERIVPLRDGARGKVSLGATTLLFQLVRPPAPQPRPQLPIAVRRRIVSDLDGPFTLLVALSFLLHLVMVVYLGQVDWPRRPSLDEVPDRFVQMVRRPKPPVAPTPRPTAASKPAPASTPKPTAPKPRPEAADVPRPAPTAAERHADLEKKVQKMGLLAVIGARADGESVTADLLAGGNVDQATEDAFKGVNGVAVAQNDSLRLLPRAGDGNGRIATPTGLRVDTRIAEATTAGPTRERSVPSVVREGAPQVEDGKVDAAAIAREIRTRRKAIAACYERALKQQPALAGKLVVRFSLAAAGTVTAVDIDDDSLGAPDVSSCIRAVVLRWRFPALTEGSAELSFPFVFQPGG
jgi:outer membrane biosynthesis protein TonB